MSDKDKIRELVMALARSKSDPSQLDVARASASAVMDAKTQRATEQMFSEAEESDDKSDDKSDDGECDDIGEGLDSAAKQHVNGPKKDLNSKQKAVEKGSRNQATTTDVDAK